MDGGNFSCAQIEAIALAHVEEIRRKIADLNKLKKTLEAMAAQCSGGIVPEWPIIDALFAVPAAPANAGRLIAPRARLKTDR